LLLKKEGGGRTSKFIRKYAIRRMHNYQLVPQHVPVSSASRCAKIITYD
jgi:hypothetical protein